MIDLTLSNQVEELFGQLFSRLRSTKQLIVVQDLYLKSYLQREILSRSPNVCIAHLEIMTLSEAVEQLLFVKNQDMRCDSFATTVDLILSAYLQSKNRSEVLLESRYGLSRDSERSSELLDPRLRHVSKEALVVSSGYCAYEEIHLFAISHMCPLFHRFFSIQAHVCPVYLYVLSVCMMFWTDVCSKKERQKLGVVADALVSDTPRFLASAGIAARNYARLLEESVDRAKEAYVVPSWAECGRHDAIASVSSSEKTALNQIQTDLLLLQQTKITPDGSVEVHAATTYLREVELLYESLAKTVGDFDAASIIVLAPSIDLYLPYIERVFAKVAFSVYGQNRFEPYGVISGFLKLLNLCHVERCFEAELSFFECRSVQKKLGVQSDDVTLFSQTIRQLAAFGAGTHFGRDFLTHWVANSDPSKLELSVENAQTVALFLQCIESLPRMDGARPVSEWAHLLQELLTAHFVRDGEEEREYDLLFWAIQSVSKSLLRYQDGYCDIALIIELIRQALDDEKYCDPFVRTSIVFASLGQFRAHPACVICLLGLDESSFPRSDMNQARLFGMQWPQQCDKHLLLEALISARQKLYISFQSISFEDQRPLRPAGAVEELVRAYDLVVQHHAIDDYEPSTRAVITGGDFFLHNAPIQEHKAQEVNISTLMQASRSPLELFFQKRGIHLFEKPPVRLSDELATIEPKLFRRLRKEAFMGSRADISQMLKRELKYLSKPLIGICEDVVQSDLELIMEHARQLDVDPERLGSITLSSSCTRPVLENVCSWYVPSIVLQDGCEITGTIDMLHPKGLISFASNEFEEHMRSFIKAVFVSYANQYYNIEVDPAILFLQTGQKLAYDIQNSREILSDFVSYAHVCAQKPLCVYPEWIKMLITEEQFPVALLEKEASDPYLALFINRVNPELLPQMWPEWRMYALRFFSTLYAEQSYAI